MGQRTVAFHLFQPSAWVTLLRSESAMSSITLTKLDVLDFKRKWFFDSPKLTGQGERGLESLISSKIYQEISILKYSRRC